MQNIKKKCMCCMYQKYRKLIFILLLFIISSCDSGCIDSNDFGTEGEIDVVTVSAQTTTCSYNKGYSIDGKNSKGTSSISTQSSTIVDCLKSSDVQTIVNQDTLNSSYIKGLKNDESSSSESDLSYGSCSDYDIITAETKNFEPKNEGYVIRNSDIQAIFDECLSYCYTACTNGETSDKRTSSGGWIKNYLKSNNNYFGITINEDSAIQMTVTGTVVLEDGTDNAISLVFNNTPYSNGNENSVLKQGSSGNLYFLYKTSNNNSGYTTQSLTNTLRQYYLDVRDYNDDYDSLQDYNYNNIKANYSTSTDTGGNSITHFEIQNEGSEGEHFRSLRVFDSDDNDSIYDYISIVNLNKILCTEGSELPTCTISESNNIDYGANITLRTITLNKKESNYDNSSYYEIKSNSTYNEVYGYIFNINGEGKSFTVDKPVQLVLRSLFTESKNNCEYNIAYKEPKYTDDEGSEATLTIKSGTGTNWKMLQINNGQNVVINRYYTSTNKLETTITITSNGNCTNKNVIVGLLPVKEFSITKSGFGVFTIPGYNNSNTEIIYSIINPSIIGTKLTENRYNTTLSGYNTYNNYIEFYKNSILDNFFEFDTADKSYIAKKAKILNSNDKSFPYFSAKSTTNETTNGDSKIINDLTEKSIYVRKGQKIRFDASNWIKLDGNSIKLNNTWEYTGNSSSIKIPFGMGLLFPILERPAYFCVGTAKEEFPNADTTKSTFCTSKTYKIDGDNVIKGVYNSANGTCNVNDEELTAKISNCNFKDVNNDLISLNNTNSSNSSSSNSYYLSYKSVINNIISYLQNVKTCFYENNTNSSNTNNLIKCSELKIIDMDCDTEKSVCFYTNGTEIDQSGTAANEVHVGFQIKKINAILEKYIKQFNSCFKYNNNRYHIKNNVLLDTNGELVYKRNALTDLKNIINNLGGNVVESADEKCTNFLTCNGIKNITKPQNNLYFDISNISDSEIKGNLTQCYNLENYVGSYNYFHGIVSNGCNSTTVKNNGCLNDKLIHFGAKKLNSFNYNNLSSGILDNFSSTQTEGSSEYIIFPIYTSKKVYFSLMTLYGDIKNMNDFITNNGLSKNTIKFRINTPNNAGENLQIVLGPDSGKCKNDGNEVNIFEDDGDINPSCTNDILKLIYIENSDLYKFSNGQLVTKTGTLGMDLNFDDTSNNKVKEFLEDKEDYVMYFKIKDKDNDIENNSGKYEVTIRNTGNSSNFISNTFKILMDEILMIMDGRSFHLAKEANGNGFRSCTQSSLDGNRCFIYNNDNNINKNRNNGKQCYVKDDEVYVYNSSGDEEELVDNKCYSSCDVLDTEEEFKTKCEFIYNSGGFLKVIYNNIIDSDLYQLIVKLCLILMLTMYGFGFFLGISSFTQEELMKKVIKIVLVYTLISPTGWKFYDKFVVSFFKQNIDSVLYLIASSFEVESSSIATYYSRGDYTNKSILFNSGYANLELIFSEAVFNKIFGLTFSSWFGPIYLYLIISAIITYCVGFITSMIMYISIQLFMSIVLAIGPFIFFFLFFEKTKKTFDNWVDILIGFALQQVFIILTISFFNNLINTVIKHVFAYKVCWQSILNINVFGIPLSLISFWKVPSGSTSGSAASLQSAIENGPGFYNIMLFYIIGTLSTKFVSSMAELGSSLGGGVSISGFSNGITKHIEQAGNTVKGGVKKVLKTPLKTASDFVGRKTNEANENSTSRMEAIKNNKKEETGATANLNSDIKPSDNAATNGNTNIQPNNNKGSSIGANAASPSTERSDGKEKSNDNKVLPLGADSSSNTDKQSEEQSEDGKKKE